MIDTNIKIIRELKKLDTGIEVPEIREPFDTLISYSTNNYD